MFLATTLKAKVALLLTSAVVASAGTVATIKAVKHHQNSVATASVPMPSAGPTEMPGPTGATSNASSIVDTTASTVEQKTAYQAVQYRPAQYQQPGYAPSQYPPYQTYQPAPGYQPAQPGYGYSGSSYYTGGTIALLNDQQLDQLLSPVALYPDPLIAEMLPAATYPDDLAAAAVWVRYNPTAPDYVIEQQPWEDSVKAVAHSPSVLTWMASNMEWTRTLGSAVTYQQGDVMNSIQRLRSQAYSAGSLMDTPQQVIVMQDRQICIVPATSEIVYVPVYDWRTVYVSRPRTPITFFAGLRIGSWLDNDCDWNDRFITVGARWDRGWDHRWDHDRNARQTAVIVRNAGDRRDNDRRDDDRRDNRADEVNRTTVNRTVNNTAVNNTTVNTRTVQVGGTAWRRNEAKAAPTLPATVKPAGRGEASVQTKVRGSDGNRTAAPVPAPKAQTPPQRKVVAPKVEPKPAPVATPKAVEPKVIEPKPEPKVAPKVIVPSPTPKAEPKIEPKPEPQAAEQIKPVPRVVVPNEVRPGANPAGRGEANRGENNRGRAAAPQANREGRDGRGNSDSDNNGNDGRGRGNR